MKNVIKGLAFNWQGTRYLRVNRDLWFWVAVPIFINLVLFVVLITQFSGLFFWVYDSLFKPIESWFVSTSPNFIGIVLAVLAWILKILFSVIIFFLCSIIGVFAVWFLGSLINAPIYEHLSEKVLLKESAVLPKSFSLKEFWQNLVHSFLIELTKSVFFIGVVGVLFVLSLIPAVGILFVILQFAFSAWYFAFGLASFPMMLKRTSFRKLMSWSWRHAGQLIGFGLPALIPFVGAVLFPLQIVGGTLLYLSNHEDSL